MTCPTCSGRGCVPDPRKVGPEMRSKRKAARISLRAMALFMGIEPGYLSDLELGRRNWPIDRTEKFAAGLKALKSK
jgi:transcriptional regulator with XRE-family HTH domain